MYACEIMFAKSWAASESLWASASRSAACCCSGVREASGAAGAGASVAAAGAGASVGAADSPFFEKKNYT